MSGTKKPSVSVRHSVDKQAPLSAASLPTNLSANEQIEYATGRPTRYLPGVILVGGSQVDVRLKWRSRQKPRQAKPARQAQETWKAPPAAAPSPMLGQDNVAYDFNQQNMATPMVSDWPASETGQDTHAMPSMFSGAGLSPSSMGVQSTSVLGEIANQICNTAQVNQRQS